MDCEFIDCSVEDIRKGIEGQEFWQCCLQTSVARATTVADQLEDVRGEHKHAKEKVQATGAEGSVDQRQNVSRTSIHKQIP